jgi:hypothetical protein
MLHLNGIMASLIALIVVNIAPATTPTFGVTSYSNGENNHYVHKSCEHAGGTYKHLPKSHNSCIFIDYHK